MVQPVQDADKPEGDKRARECSRQPESGMTGDDSQSSPRKRKAGARHGFPRSSHHSKKHESNLGHSRTESNVF